MLAKVDELAAYGIGKTAGTAAEARLRFEESDKELFRGQGEGGSEARETAAEDESGVGHLKGAW